MRYLDIRHGTIPNPVALENARGAQRKENPFKGTLLEHIVSCIDRNTFDLADAHEARGGFCAL